MKISSYYIVLIVNVLKTNKLEDLDLFPKFLLRKMYVKGSMKLEEDGFSFILKNSIANGTITEVYSLKVNTLEVPFNQVEIDTNGRKRSTDTINELDPVMLIKGVDTKFIVHFNNGLELGQTYTVELNFRVKEIGTMKFDFSDQLSN